MNPTAYVDAILPLRIMLCAKPSGLKEIEQVLQIAIKTMKSRSNVILYFLEQSALNSMKNKIPSLQCNLVTENDPPVDYVVTFGGDGTILYAAKIFKKHNPIFLTFKMGTLGFLCKFSLEQMRPVLHQAITIRNLSDEDQFPFQVRKLLRIEGVIKNGENLQEPITVLNQISIMRDFKSRIILQIYVNNQFLTQTGGDGILISTPTGSTAYSLSAGGPVVQNQVNCMIVVPISPHSLSFRPLCLNISSTIRIKLSQKSNSNGWISFDGQTNMIFGQGDEVIIKRSQKYLVFYEPKQDERMLPNWGKRLRMFLNWNQPFKSNQQNTESELHITKNLLQLSKPKL